MDDDGDSEPSSRTRRGVLGGTVAIALYLGGWVSKGAAQAMPSGDIASQSEPALTVYADKVNYFPRTSDPSSPDDGESWFNEDA